MYAATRISLPPEALRRLTAERRADRAGRGAHERRIVLRVAVLAAVAAVVQVLLAV